MSAKHVKRAAPKRKAAKPRTKTTAATKKVAKAVGASQASADRVARGALIALGLVVVIAVLFALGIPAQAGRAAGEAIGDMGFRVDRVDVVGIEQMDSKPVYDVAFRTRDRSPALPLVDVDGIRKELLSEGWVKDARVSRRYPDTLVIDIGERTPAALWQGQKSLFLVDEEGVLLDRVPIAEMPDLPLLMGEGANRQYPALQRLLDGEPGLKAQLASARWVGERRWDLNVQTGEILALPEGERQAADALEKFMRKDRATPLLGIGVERYDLRIDGQMIARSPALAEEASN